MLPPETILPEPIQPPEPNSFTDLSGQSHQIELSFRSLRAIKVCGVDFGKIDQVGVAWAAILADDELALRVIRAALGDAAPSEAEWLAQMDGATLEAAREALLGALINFSPAKRQMIAAGAAKIQQKYQQAIDEATTRIENLTDESIDRAERQLQRKQHRKAPGKSPQK